MAVVRLVLAFAGVALVLVPADASIERLLGHLSGADLLALAGGFCFALTSVTLRRLAALNRVYDGTRSVAIDTSAYVPRHVRSMATALAGRVGQYQLVSTISVYANFDAAVTDATSFALVTLSAGP